MAVEDAQQDHVDDAEMKTVTTAVARVDDKQPAKPAPRPQDLKDMNSREFAQLAVASGLFKDAADMAKTAMKIKIGHAMGVDEATAMNNIIIVQGRISFTAAFLAARVKSSGRYRYKLLEKSAKACRIQFYEKVDKFTATGKPVFEWEPTGVEEVFTIEMAERAGLTKNVTWKSYTEAMLYNRCISAGVRAHAPDTLLGYRAYTPEEIDPTLNVTVDESGEAVVDIEEAEATTTARPQPPPKPAAKPAAPAKPAVTAAAVKDFASKAGIDLKPFADHYGKSQLSDLTPTELADIDRKVRQRAAATPATAA